MKKYSLLFLFTFYSILSSAQSQGAFTVGPMLHFNISGKTLQPSFGIEAAYWNLDKFPAGLDVGWEFQKGAQRFYLEGQVGIGLAGVAFGPVFEKKKDDVIRLGIQTNIWANYIAGVNLRWRRINGEKTFAPGLYAKYPILFGFEKDEEGDIDWSDIFDD